MAVSIFVEIEPVSEIVDSYKVVEAASWRSASRAHVPESEYRLMGLIASDEASLHIGGPYEEAFGVAPVGSLIPVRVRVINSITGLASSYIYNRAIVEV